MRRSPFIAAVIAASLVHALGSQQPQALPLTGAYALTHDPSIAKEGTNYYVFATGRAPGGGQLAIRCSSNLTEWKLCGHVFDDVPAWIRADSPKTKDLWAPDISRFNGKYHLYYAYSSFGANTSGIALATNDTLDPQSPSYHWKDGGLVLKSVASDDFNAIDPNIILDDKGKPWLSFGSFWSGIKMRQIDLTTGKLSAADSTLYSLASRARPEGAEDPPPGRPANWQAIEAPFIVRHQGFYYLFVSFDLCCRGTRSTYRIMVGRSAKVTGPYLDASGAQMSKGGGTELLTGNQRWLGPGGQSVLQRPEGDLMVFHAYDAQTGKSALQISTIAWTDGWPHVALSTTGEAK